jgi:Cu/Ag efflux protein CusF
MIVRTLLVKKALSIALATLLAITVVGLAVAKDNVKIKKLITGEVVTVDTAANSLTLKGKRAEVVIHTNEDTVVQVAKEKKSLADVKVGAKIAVRYSDIDGEYLAESIVVRPEKGPVPAKPAKPEKPARKYY